MKLTPAGFLLLGVLASAVSAFGAAAAPGGNHVVIVVMDGLRPDSVVEPVMPNLSRLAREGTFFARHHPVYVSSTEVNGAALATGGVPARTGITGNVEYRPAVDALFPVGMDDETAIWQGDRASGNKWVGLETLPQLVRAAGRRTAVAGTKGVAILWDRLRENRTPESATVFGGETIPTSVKDTIVSQIGPIPTLRSRSYFVNTVQDEWTTSALTRVLWGAGELPALSVLWLSEPDYSQHGTGPNSAQSRAALTSSDTQLGRVLAALETSGRRANTNVLVVSDHGFSTISGAIDVATDLARQGFRIGGGFLEAPPAGTVVFIGLGGSFSLNVVGRDQTTIQRLVSHLQTTNYVGVIFTRDGLPGTFKLADAGINAPDAPDILVSMRWSPEAPPGPGALPGLIYHSAADYSVGLGMHGSLSRFDMNNTLIASGPAFKRGFRSEVPSANNDVAPTVLSILGVPLPASMDGRVLEEALVAGSGPAPAVETTVLEASTRVGPRLWQQYLKVSRVGRHAYYDEGNAGPPPAAR